MRLVVVVVTVASAWVGCGGITERTLDEQAPNQQGAGTGGTTSVKPPVQSPASGDPCFNDSDCPDAACGGEVCNWNMLNPNPVAEKVFVCTHPGIGPQGQEGWCTTHTDCKCRGLGAKCVGVYCSFTQPEDAP
jgi:hypothetical protein